MECNCIRNITDGPRLQPIDPIGKSGTMTTNGIHLLRTLPGSSGKLHRYFTHKNAMVRYSVLDTT